MAQAMRLQSEKNPCAKCKISLKSGPTSRTVFRSTFLIPLNRKVLEKGPFYGTDFWARFAAKMQYNPNIVMQFSHAPLSRPGQSLLCILGDTCADIHTSPLRSNGSTTRQQREAAQKVAPAQPHYFHPKQRRTGKLK